MKPGAGLKEGEKVPGKTTGTLMSIAGLWKKKAVDEEAGTSSGRGESAWEGLSEVYEAYIRGRRCRSERKQQGEGDSLSNVVRATSLLPRWTIVSPSLPLCYPAFLGTLYLVTKYPPTSYTPAS